MGAFFVELCFSFHRVGRHETSVGVLVVTVCVVSVCTGVRASMCAEALCAFARVARVGEEGVSVDAVVGTSAARS